MATELCLCGHPHSHHGSRPGQICIVCEQEDRHPSRCWGWFPQGSKAIEVDEHGEEVPDARDQVGLADTAPAEPTRGGDAHADALDREHRGTSTAGAHVTGPAVASPPATAGPPDLDQATAAAAQALGDIPDGYGVPSINVPGITRVAVEAAAPVLHAALRDRHADLEVFAQAVRKAATCNYDSYGMTQIDKALAALDGPAAQEEDRCQNCGTSLAKTTHAWWSLGSCELYPSGAAQEEDG